MDDTISRQAAIEACNQQTMDCNPDHFNGHEHFTEFLDDATIGSFGKWQFANGFNVGVMAARIAIKNIDPAHGRWIPVTERLPEKGQIVVAVGEKGTWDVGMFSGLAFSNLDPSEWNWKKNTIKTVKWWMLKKDALPEPPKEEE